MFLFRAHDFVSGGLAYCFRHGGSRYTMLGCSYPVRNALPRHLRSFNVTTTHKKTLTHSHTHTKTGRWVKSSLVWGLSLSKIKKKKRKKEKGKPPPTSATFCRTPPTNSLPPHLSFPSSVGMKRAARLWQTKTRGGRNKEELSPTTTTVTDKCGECFFRVGSGSFR